MQKYDVSKYIISNLLIDLPASQEQIANRILISNIVDGWNNNVYFQPRERLKINHYIPKNPHLM